MHPPDGRSSSTASASFQSEFIKDDRSREGGKAKGSALLLPGPKKGKPFLPTTSTVLMFGRDHDGTKD
jgi:hypothetical protein